MVPWDGFEPSSPGPQPSVLPDKLLTASIAFYSSYYNTKNSKSQYPNFLFTIDFSFNL